MLFGLLALVASTGMVYLGTEYVLSFYREPYDKNTRKASVVLTLAWALSFASFAVLGNLLPGEELGGKIATCIAIAIFIAAFVIAWRILRTNGRFVWPQMWAPKGRSKSK
jgi:hypothetical protein